MPPPSSKAHDGSTAHGDNVVVAHPPNPVGRPVTGHVVNVTVHALELLERLPQGEYRGMMESVAQRLVAQAIDELQHAASYGAQKVQKHQGQRSGLYQLQPG